MQVSCRHIFCLFKKDGRLRLIIAGRIASCWFKAPDRVHLASGASFAKLEVDSDEGIWVGEVDLADAFYNWDVRAVQWKSFLQGLANAT